MTARSNEDVVRDYLDAPAWRAAWVEPLAREKG